MDRSVSPSATLSSPEPPPSPAKARPSALKRTKSIKTAHVQFGDVAFEPGLTPRSPLLPPSPTTECSTPRQHARPALKKTGSAGSTRRSLPKPLFHDEGFESSVSTEGGHGPQIFVTGGDGPDYFGDSSPGPFFNDSRSPPDLDPRAVLRPPNLPRRLSTRERSSARDLAPDAKPVKILRNMVDTLRASRIPGPELLRSRSDFRKSLGYGGEGNVQGTDEEVEEKMRKARKNHSPEWIAHRFAIKRHGPQQGRTGYRFESYLASAAAEIQAFAKLPDGHPNIIQLQGWGLCLDTIESLSKPPADLSSFSLHLPLLVFKRADGDLNEFLDELFTSGDEPKPEGCHSLQSCAEAGLLHHPIPLSSPGSEGYGASTPLDGVPLVTDERQCLADPGYRTPYMAVHGPAQPEGYSLSGSTLNDYQGGNMDATATAGGGTPSTSRKPRRFQIVKGIDRDEVIRGLCIDIGHGLQHLHRLNMTHGDLKPRNVLVCSDGPRWTAKLCDLGHSRSFGPTDGGIETAAEYPYRGTEDWRPHWFGSSEKKHNQETLKSFDRTVYGALVWSAFSPTLRGRKPPISDPSGGRPNPCVHLPSHLKQMTPEGNCGSALGSKATLTHCVGRLVEGTVCEGFLLAVELDEGVAKPKHQVEDRPWRHLYSKTERAVRALWHGVKAAEQEANRDTNPPPSTISDSDTMTEASPRSGSREGIQSASDSSVMLTRSLTPTIKSQRSAASEIWWRENDSAEMGLVHDRLQSLISNHSRDTDEPGSLYGVACLRAKAIQSAKWDKIPGRKNIVELALQARPPLDICTLAWLCRGDVGADEVHNLRPYYSVWKVVLNPDALSESERLERFLLLMQFGAPIEQVLQHHPASRAPRSILSHYLRSCRTAILPAVSDEICLRYGVVLDADKTHDHDHSTKYRSTKYFMTAASNCRPRHLSDDAETIAASTALGNIELDRRHYGASFQVLRLNFQQLLDEKNDVDIARARVPSSETTPLLLNPRGLSRAFSNYEVASKKWPPPTTPTTTTAATAATPPDQTESPRLPVYYVKAPPPGWTQRGEAYVNELTGSITLREPKIKIKHLRRISIGYLGTPHVWEIDIADFALPQHYHYHNHSNLHDKEEARYRFRKRIRARFAPFDDAWFSNERHWTVPQEDRDDVLADIKDIVTTTTDDSSSDNIITTRALRRTYGGGVGSSPSPSLSTSSAFHIRLLRNSQETALLRILRILLFFFQYPMTTLGMLWRYIVVAHDLHGAPIEVAYDSLRDGLRLLRRDMVAGRYPLWSLLRWIPALLGRFVLLLLACLACLTCLVGFALVIAAVLALVITIALAFAAL